jgi:hypothetical protein
MEISTPMNDLVIKVELLRLEVERLLLENWQLRGALGYPVPGAIPEGDFKCGLCDARRNEH